MEAVNVAAWKVSHPYAFIALELALKERTVRLTSGGTVVFGGQTYHPEDEDLGVLSEIGEVNEGEVSEATAPDLMFQAYTDEGVAELAASQGGAWTLYWGTIEPTTGAVIGTPETVTRGYLNVGTLSFGEAQRGLSFSSYTEEQFQLLSDAQRRLNPSHHKSVWGSSNEAGLDYVTEYDRKIFWRAKQPRGSIGYGGGGDPGGSGPGIINRLF